MLMAYFSSNVISGALKKRHGNSVFFKGFLKHHGHNERDCPLEKKNGRRGCLCQAIMLCYAVDHISGAPPAEPFQG